MKKLITVLTMLVVVAMAGAAAADILWDQSVGYEGWQQGFFNVEAGAPPFGITAYTVNDIVVPAGGWVVDTYRVYYDGFDPNWAGSVTSASLFLEPKTGALPIGVPDGSTVVPVTVTVLGNGFLEVTAEGLGLAINEGEYWIGLTPTAPDANNIHVSVPAVGDDSPTYDTGGFPMPMWANWAPGLDGAILLEGTTGAVAVENDTWGGLKAVYR
jgi:hypothetical protein